MPTTMILTPTTGMNVFLAPFKKRLDAQNAAQFEAAPLLSEAEIDAFLAPIKERLDAEMANKEK